MPDPLEYQSPIEIRPWSIAAILGFALAIGGPLPGLALRAAFGIVTYGALGLLLVCLLPWGLGLLLCSVGLSETKVPASSKRGRRLAWAGFWVAGIWVGLILLAFLLLFRVTNEGVRL